MAYPPYTVLYTISNTICSDPHYLLITNGQVYATCYSPVGIASVISFPFSNPNNVVALAFSSQCIGPSHLSLGSNNIDVHVACFGGGILTLRNSSVIYTVSSIQCDSPAFTAYSSYLNQLLAVCYVNSIISINDVYGCIPGTQSSLYTTCSLCPFGTYRSQSMVLSNALTCSSCQSGSINFNQTLTCSICPVGTCNY